MVTEDERRRAAAALRAIEVPERVKRKEHPELTAAWYELLCGAVGGKKDPWYGIKALADRLADLIDPEPERTCRMVRDNLTDTTYCDVCGERFDQPWYLGAKPHGVDILVYHVEYRDARYCPHCGAKVVSYGME